MEELIKRFTFEAEDLVIQGDLEGAKQLYLKVTKMNPYDPLIWRSLGSIFLKQDKLLECFN